MCKGFSIVLYFMSCKFNGDSGFPVFFSPEYFDFVRTNWVCVKYVI